MKLEPISSSKNNHTVAGKSQSNSLIENPIETKIASHSQKIDYQNSSISNVSRGRGRWLMIFQLFLFVGIPTMLAVAYYGFIASGRYVSSTQIVIQSAEMSSSMGGIQGLLGGGMLAGGGMGGSQGDILAAYIHSTSILDTLDELLDLRDVYSPDRVDEISKLGSKSSQEKFLEYYKSMTAVQWDAATSMLTIEVEAFSPNDSKLILDTIIMLSEEKLNSLSERKQRDRVVFARQELSLAEKRLYGARLAVTEFRRKYGEIDPVKAAEASGGLLASIQAQLAAERAQLSTLQFAMHSGSPQVRAAKVRIVALETQAKLERSNLAGNSGVVLSDLVSEFEGLLIEEDFARAAYTSALAFLENTRASAQQESSYVVDFIAANMPDEATRPARLVIILTVFLVSLLSLGILKLIVAAIKEQAKL